MTHSHSKTKKHKELADLKVKSIPLLTKKPENKELQQQETEEKPKEDRIKEATRTISFPLTNSVAAHRAEIQYCGLRGGSLLETRRDL